MIKEIYVTTIDSEPVYSADTKEKAIDIINAIKKDIVIISIPKSIVMIPDKTLDERIVLLSTGSVCVRYASSL